MNAFIGPLKFTQEFDLLIILVDIVTVPLPHQFIHQYSGATVTRHVITLQFNDLIQHVGNGAKHTVTGSGDVRGETHLIAIHENVKGQIPANRSI